MVAASIRNSARYDQPARAPAASGAIAKPRLIAQYR
jgi:hypothetical protein